MIEHSKLKLAGQIAVVTGGAQGIGAECALALAREGAEIVIVDFKNANDTVKNIKKEVKDTNVIAEEVDIRSRQKVKELIEKIIQRSGKIDIIVNSAGTGSRLGLEEMTDEDWDRDIETNLYGTFLLTQLAVFPYMKKQKYGRIINISSISGIIGGLTSKKNSSGKSSGRSGPAYAASKGGVIALTKWVAKEVGQYGINCNSVAPGAVETEMTKGAVYELEKQAIRRMGTPKDIAEAVVFLASPSSSFITGQILRVCGGKAIC